MFEIDTHTTRRIVGLLLDIRAALMRDNNLSLRVARRGCFAATDALDTTIETLIELESAYEQCKMERDGQKELVEMYSNMLGDYDAETLSDERKAELKALVDKWQKEDEAE